MTQEDKQLLLKDLCARLPYGVYMHHKNFPEANLKLSAVFSDNRIGVKQNEIGLTPTSINECKPYLRPLSSMTEEELRELNDKYGSIAYFFIQEPPYYHGLQAQHSDIGSIEISEFSEIYDWLNAHHFDYRGLIEKGLALEAPEGMYKAK